MALSNYFNQDKIGEILKDADLVDKKADETEINDAFQKYVERFKEMGGAGIDKDQVNTVREEIDELNASLEEETEVLEKLDKGSKAYQNQEKRVASLTEQLEESQTQLEQLAAAELETSNGMDDLAKNWKNIDDALTNSTSTAELAKTYDELQGILGKLLNVDPSMITQGFMESADVLAALGDMADGDAEAI
jgi:predicted RNase H-like nuclease (RuvC/YqgF family)